MSACRVLGLLVVLLVCACGGGTLTPPPTFEVSAKVSGLEGNGLVLEMHGEPLAIPQDGSYTFTTRMTDGEQVVVTIAAPPTEGRAQDCVLSGSGGVVKSKDYVVSVTCTTREFSIGGTISGLDGSIGVEMNGRPLTLSKNGPFTFTRKLPDGMDYSVRIASQPSTQWCELSDGAGQVAGADVTSVKVSCVNVYDVNFTLSGATGPVTLRCNGNDYSCDENGMWQFGEDLFDGDAYEVTVVESPAGQTCSVANGKGSIRGADVEVVVTCVDL